MRKVFVLNKGAHNYSDAERYGDLIYCTDGAIDKLDIQQMFRELQPHIADSSPDDYILLTSLTSLCSVACAMFAAKHGRLNLLIFKGDGYISRSIYFNKEGKNGPRIGRLFARSGK